MKKKGHKKRWTRMSLNPQSPDEVRKIPTRKTGQHVVHVNNVTTLNKVDCRDAGKSADPTTAHNVVKSILGCLSMSSADDLVDWFKHASTESAVTALDIITVDLFNTIKLHSSIVETYGIVISNLLTWFKSKEGLLVMPGGFEKLRGDIVGKCQDMMVDYMSYNSVTQDAKNEVTYSIRLLGFLLRGGHCSSSVTHILVSDALLHCDDDLVIKSLLLFLSRTLTLEFTQLDVILSQLERVAIHLSPLSQERVLRFICSKRSGRRVAAVQTDSILQGLSFTECHGQPHQWFNDFIW